MGAGRFAVIAALDFGSPHWSLTAIGLAVVGALLLLFRGVLLRNRGHLASLAKLVALVLLVACLVEPLWTEQRVRPHENLFLIVVDHSRSLSIADTQGRPRSEGIRELLEEETADWQVSLTREFDVRRFLVGEGLHSVTGYSQLEFDAPASNLETSLDLLRRRYSDHPVAGILLFSDGLATDLVDRSSTSVRGVAEEAGLSIVGGPPIYPVIPNEWSQVYGSDLAIRRVSITETPFEDAPLKIHVDLRALQGETDFQVRLIDGSSEVTDEQDGRTDANGSASVVFEFLPDVTTDSRAGLADTGRPRLTGRGAHFYTVQVMAPGEWDEFGMGAGEATWANNSRLICIHRPLEPLRVLYVAGRPNWEFKFLRRALDEDQQVSLVGLIRIARREGKFDFRGRSGESTNPLFSGFGADAAAGAETFDEPVLVRLGTLDESELQRGFPATRAELYQFDAIILDDVEAEFFTRDQLEMLNGFVADRGGGLMMLGGIDTLRHGNWNSTPVASGLPVWLSGPVSIGTTAELPNPVESSQFLSSGNWLWRLTREGWLEPAVRRFETQEAELEGLRRLPGFHSISRVGRPKPAARVLAEVVNSQGEVLPAFVVQPYGVGRVGVLAIGDFWRWSLSREADVSDELPAMWRQMVRWLVADVPRRVELRVEPDSSTVGSGLRVLVDARGETFTPLAEATIQLTIQTPEGRSLSVPAEPSLEAPGRFVFSYVPQTAGGYRFHAVGTDASGEVFGEAEAGWTHDPLAREFDSLPIRREWLEALARESGGEVVPAHQLDSFVASLPTRESPVMETWSTPLWHRGSVLGIILGLLLLEWLLRRRQGLA